MEEKVLKTIRGAIMGKQIEILNEAHKTADVQQLRGLVAAAVAQSASDNLNRRLDKLVEELKTMPVRIIKSGPATIVFWGDGTKTVVKCGEDTIPDDYAAFCAALGKKVFGSNSALKRAMFNAMDEEKKDMEDEPGGSA